MKRQTLLLLLALMVAFVSNADVNAEAGTGSMPRNIIIQKTKGNRPHDTSGSEAGVSCVYLNGYITVEFAQPEGRGRIKVTCVDSGESVSNWFYTITPYSIYVGDTPGVYQIDITTSQNSYEGTLIL